MSGPEEAVLSAQERAALAQLEQRAAADDPRLASQLRGAARRRAATARLVAAVAHLWAALRPAVWGPVLLVAGLTLTAVGVGAGLALGVVGVVLTTAALSLLVRLAAGSAAGD